MNDLAMIMHIGGGYVHRLVLQSAEDILLHGDAAAALPGIISLPF